MDLRKKVALKTTPHNMNRNTCSLLPLFMLSEGETARVVCINGGYGVRKRLADIGIIPGKTIRIAHGTGHGPRVVMVDETKVMVGWGMLHKILVELWPKF